MSGRRKRTVVEGRHPAGPEHEVVSLSGGGASYKRSPCQECPWRKDRVGNFPAEAFRHSTNTACDMSEHTFACHMAGAERPATCAGFILNGADHNLAARIHYLKGDWDFDAVSDGGHDLWPSYKEMAIANGVAPDDPVLERCRANDE